MAHLLSCHPARPAFASAAGHQTRHTLAGPLRQQCAPSHPSGRTRRVSPLMAETKKRKAFGEWLIETDDPSSLEQPPTSDFWEGPQFEIIGKTAGFAIPVLVVLLILVGFFAASSYDGGATSVMRPATSPEDTGSITPNVDFDNDQP